MCVRKLLNCDDGPTFEHFSVLLQPDIIKTQNMCETQVHHSHDAAHIRIMFRLLRGSEVKIVLNHFHRQHFVIRGSVCNRTGEAIKEEIERR